jgi:sec-independent protein translocase protein TatA
MGGLSAWHLLIVLAVFVLLFGARKLPDAARSLGRSARIFKAETQGLLGGDDHHEQAVTAAQAPTQTAEATRLQDQAAQLRAQAAQLEQAARAAEAQAQLPSDQAPKTV